jgi:hypothetical protein
LFGFQGFLITLIGAILGAIYGAAFRAYEGPYGRSLIFGWALIYSTVYLISWDDWAIAGWHGRFGVIIGVTIVALVVALAAKIECVKGIIGTLVAKVTCVLAWALGVVGSEVFLAMVGGQIGNALGGRIGLVSGELLGAGLGGPLVIAFTARNLKDISTPGLPAPKLWTGAFVLLGMTNVSMAWFLFVEPAGGFELRQFEHPHGVTAVTFSPQGKSVLSGANDGIRLWEIPQSQGV